MKLRLEQTSNFREDFALQALWYVREVGPDVARRYEEAVNATLELLSREPLLGRVRRFRHPKLQGLRSFVVQRPFNTLIVFYRTSGDTLQVWRLMHGGRDLPKRLTESPK